MGCLKIMVLRVKRKGSSTTQEEKKGIIDIVTNWSINHIANSYCIAELIIDGSLEHVALVSYNLMDNSCAVKTRTNGLYKQSY